MDGVLMWRRAWNIRRYYREPEADVVMSYGGIAFVHMGCVSKTVSALYERVCIGRISHVNLAPNPDSMSP